MSQPFDPTPAVAAETGLPKSGIAAVIRLLADGNTVPFIARYRKEATGNLDEVQIRDIQDKAAYLREMHDRRQTILATIDEQGQLTDALRKRIDACTTKAELEDLYLPFKPKRRTKATIARERGLEPLATRILAQPRDGDPRREAAAFVDPAREVPDVDAALEGARNIVAEAVVENADVRAVVREAFREHGVLVAEATAEAREKRTRFEQYYDYREPVKRVPSHRYLAVRRGERETMLRVSVDVELERLYPRIEGLMGLDRRSPFAGQLSEAVQYATRRRIAPSVETDVRVEMKLAADRDAVEIFARNLRELLLASPLGGKAVIGIDPGLRTGCKTVALDATGRLLTHTVIFPGRNPGKDAEAAATLARLVKQHRPDAVAVGNGTGGRETERFAKKALRDAGIEVMVVSVNEAGASVYSASDIAREEFPDHDLTVRGAVSIGRRLQDPLAELVKIDPKSIGVGQYQHDVHQPMLQRKLDEVVESCVNHVGVDLNTASAPLLAQVAGIGPSLSKKIIAHRDQQGRFSRRGELLAVSGLGPRTYEQCAGFLRIPGGTDPLDASAVHPERYDLVQRMARDLGVDVGRLVGDPALADRIELARYVGGDVGRPTLEDIIAELKKPGRDPRSTFDPPKFRDDVETLDDLREGMVLEGVVTNVTAFGAFVDIGVHQDGLVHISQLADRFVKDPAEVVAPGDRLKVRVLSVDLERKRIGLSARMSAEPGEKSADGRGESRSGRDAGRSGGQRRGGQRSGGQQRGGQRSGGQRSGGQQRGGQRSGGQQRGGQRSGGQRSGGQRSGGRRDDTRGARTDARRGDKRRDDRAGKSDGGFRHNPFADLLKDR